MIPSNSILFCTDLVIWVKLSLIWELFRYLWFSEFPHHFPLFLFYEDNHLMFKYVSLFSHFYLIAKYQSAGNTTNWTLRYMYLPPPSPSMNHPLHLLFKRYSSIRNNNQKYKLRQPTEKWSVLMHKLPNLA